MEYGPKNTKYSISWAYSHVYPPITGEKLGLIYTAYFIPLAGINICYVRAFIPFPVLFY